LLRSTGRAGEHVHNMYSWKALRSESYIGACVMIIKSPKVL
jgi:hypothetical protein